MPNEPHWLPIEAVIEANRLEVEATGEHHFVRDVGLLESALARPQNAFAYGEDDIVTLAVRLMAGIAQAHALNRVTSARHSRRCGTFFALMATI